MSRCLHFVPADKTSHLKKIRHLGAKSIILDLEDSVATPKKSVARKNLEKFYQSADPQNTYVRINHKSSPEYIQDIRLLSKINPSGVVLPKVEDCDYLQTILNQILSIRAKFKIIILIESYKGLRNLPDILRNKNVVAVGLGLEDFFSDQLLFQEKAPDLTKHIKLDFITKTKSFGLPAINSVSLEYRDLEKLKSDVQESRNLGFDGMFSIHPKQIEVIQDVFMPDPVEIKWAQNIIKLSNETTDTGYLKVEETIISPPKIKKAKLILERLSSSKNK